LAARTAIPPTLHEAIALEGGSPWFAMTRVTLPLMTPIILVLAQYLGLHLMQLRDDVRFLPDLKVERASLLAGVRRRDVVVVFDYRRYERRVRTWRPCPAMSWIPAEVR
ncbi:hypothetical protein ACFPM7_15945, partial [Actinokineospora guangxiensis]